jgi:hypothetical protein
MSRVLWRAALLIALLTALAPLAPRAMAQHGDDHDAAPSGTLNAIRAQAAPGLVRLESLRFT